MNKSFYDVAWNDYIFWQEHDKKILKKINTLIKDIERNGVDRGLGKPEKLKHDLSGLYSRRINDEHRLVYFVENETIYIVGCKTHYE